MKDALFNQRKRMLTLLGARNKPSAVFKVVAEEFKVPVDNVRRDYYRMKKWTHAVTQEAQATAIALECMDFGVRQAVDLLLSIQPEAPGRQLSIKQGFLKVAAINAYTKAVVEENHFKQTLGILTRKPEVVVNVNHDLGGQEIDLGRLPDDERKTILYAEEILTRTEKATGAR